MTTSENLEFCIFTEIEIVWNQQNLKNYSFANSFLNCIKPGMPDQVSKKDQIDRQKKPNVAK